MSVANLSVRRPVLMTVMALVIILLGAFGASNLGVREYPNVDYPLIQVRTSYPGANAAVVEAEVTEILEASINRSIHQQRIGHQGAYLHEPRRLLVHQY